MADLITHGCVALLVKAPTARRHVGTFIAGTFLPDLVSRVPSSALSLFSREVLPLPAELVYAWDVLHLPIGMVLLAWTLQALFPRADQRAALRNLLGGMLLHLGVDLLQDHLGGGYLLLWPLTSRAWELRVMGSEDSIFLIPVLVPLTWWAWRALAPARTVAPPPAPTPSSPA